MDIQELLKEINSCEENTEWKSDNLKQRYPDEVFIGQLNSFEKKCLICIDKINDMHKEHDVKSIAQFEKDFPDFAGVKNPIDLFDKFKDNKELKKRLDEQSLKCRNFNKQMQMVKQIMWFNIEQRFSDKNSSGIFIRKKGTLIFSEEASLQAEFSEVMDDVENAIDKMVQSNSMSHNVSLHSTLFGKGGDA